MLVPLPEATQLSCFDFARAEHGTCSFTTNRRTTQNLEAGPPKPGWRRLPSPERGPAQCLGSVSCRTGHQRTRMASETFEVSFAQSSYLLFFCCPRSSHGIMHRNCIHWVDGVNCIDCLQGAREARTEALRGMQECATR